MDLALKKFLRIDNSTNEHPDITDPKILENVYQLYFNNIENCLDDPICYYYYGLYFQITAKYDKMKDYYEKAYKQNMFLALNNLGFHYQYQCYDHSLARKYFNEAIKKGVFLSIVNKTDLCICRWTGRCDKCIKYLLMGVDKGHPGCINRLISHYKYNRPKNNMELLKLYAKINQIDKCMKIINKYFLEKQDDHDMILVIIETIENMEIQNELPNGIKFIKNLLCHQIDIMKLHFEYTVNGKGYEEAKKDYINFIQQNFE